MKIRQILTHASLGLLATATLASAPLLTAAPSTAQRIVSATPGGPGVAGNTPITWQFDDFRLVNPQSIRVQLNGRDITNQVTATMATGTFTHTPPQPLPAGNYTVQVEFANTQGAGYRGTWSFQVADVTLALTTVTHNGVTPLVSGDTFTAELRGTAGANASVLLVQNGQTVRTLTATETASGVYRVTLPVGSNDRVTEGVVIGRLERSGRVVYSVAPQAFAFNPAQTTAQVEQTQVGGGVTTTPTGTAQPLTVELTSHQNNGVVNAANGFTFTGRTLPGANVVVTVVSEAPSALGGLIRLGGGSTLLDRTPTTVRPDGTFSVTVPRPPVVQRGMRYQITIQADHQDASRIMNLTLVQQ